MSDPAHKTPHNALEIAIGRQVRRYRLQQGLTVADLARVAGISNGMLSKIENGHISPSLSSLTSVAGALNVPVTALFRQFEETHEATLVRAGQGLNIERQGTRAGHQYQLLGHSSGNQSMMEPYIVTLSEESDVFPIFQHEGIEFIYVLSGKVVYRHANKTYLLNTGDSLYFDSNAPHGPEELIEMPIRLLTVISRKAEP